MSLPFKIAALCLTAAGMAAQKAPSNIPVTTILHDYDTAASPNLLLTRSDHANGYQQASYTNQSKSGGSGGMTSVVFPAAGWQLYIGNQTVRTVWVTVSQPVAGSPTVPAPDGYYYANVELYSRCYDLNNQQIPLVSIPPGMSNNRCDFGYDFSYNRIKYKLVMGPVNQAGTGWATVSCNGGPNATTCASWSIVPNMNAGGGNVPTVANLYKFGTSGNLIYIGQYYNTYRVDITNP